MIDIEKIGDYYYISADNKVMITLPENVFVELCKAIDEFKVKEIWKS